MSESLSTTNPYWVRLSGNTSPKKGFTELLTNAMDATTEALSKLAPFVAFQKCSQWTGGYVLINPELSCLPALIGDDGRPVFLYKVVEVLDDLVDYDDIKKECPTLSYSQINGAIGFLRRLSQLNAEGVDIDAMEDEADANDSVLTNALRNALKEMETSRVRDND